VAGKNWPYVSQSLILLLILIFGHNLKLLGYHRNTILQNNVKQAGAELGPDQVKDEAVVSCR